MNSNECSFAHHRCNLPNAMTNTKNVQHFLYMYPKSYIVERATEFQVFVPLIIKDRQCIRSIRYQVCAQISDFLCHSVAHFCLSLAPFLSIYIYSTLSNRSFQQLQYPVSFITSFRTMLFIFNSLQSNFNFYKRIRARCPNTYYHTTIAMTSSACVFRLFHLILVSNYGIRLRQRPCCTFDATIKPKFNCEFVRYFSFRVFQGFFFYSVCMKCTLFSLHQSSIYSIVYHYNAYAEKRIAERLHSFSENDCRFSQNSFNSYKLAVSVWAIQCNKSQAQFYCSFTFSNVICV